MISPTRSVNSKLETTDLTTAGTAYSTIDVWITISYTSIIASNTSSFASNSGAIPSYTTTLAIV